MRRRRGKALVLTGTASVFPVCVLRAVRQARRDGRLPDRSGGGAVYDTRGFFRGNWAALWRDDLRPPGTRRLSMTRLAEGLLDSPMVSHTQTLTIMRQMDGIREQVGVRYAGD